MKRFYCILIVAAAVLQACSTETSSGNEPVPVSDTAAAESATEEAGPKKTTDPATRIFAFPATISDETLDDFFDEKTAKTLSEEQERTFSLKALEDTKGNDYSIPGEFDLSEQFTTRLVLRNSDWTETVGWLVNYDTEGKLIDHLKVFYSDNVEAYRSIASRISSEGIAVTTDTYEHLGEDEKVTTTRTNYRIEANGRFVQE